MDFSQYAKWFINCITCKKCDEKYLWGQQEGRRKGFLCNDNIDAERNDKPDYYIRPQAGYIDKEWFSFKKDSIHILLIGQNPRDGYKEDDELYKIYDEIINGINSGVDKEDIVCKKIYESNGIKKQVTGYKPLSILVDDIKIIINDNLSVTNTVFAYTNQILCRTIPEAGSIRGRAYFQDVYQNCFNQHIKELIKIAEPNLIIVLGWTSESPFKKLISNDSFRDLTYYVVVPHPTRRKAEAIKEIDKFIINNLKNKI